MACLEQRLVQKIGALNLKISENRTALIRRQRGQLAVLIGLLVAF